MGKKKSAKKKKHPRKDKSSDLQQQGVQRNFYADAGPGCYIARPELPQKWIIDWEDVDPEDFEDINEVPDVAVDTEEKTLSVCNIDSDKCIVAYVTVYETKVMGADGKELPQGKTKDGKTGNWTDCVTFIVFCPPRIFVHLCYLDIDDKDDNLTSVRIESDVSEWSRHPHPNDEHPLRLGFPLSDGPFLCTQGEEGALTHFFSGNLHAIDFRCAVGTPLLAVGDGFVVDVKVGATVSGIAVTNLFEWSSIMIRLDHATVVNETTSNKMQEDHIKDGSLFVEYVHISSAGVKVGEKVRKGQVIGSSGSIGFSPEPHLHFSAFRSNDPTAPTVRVKFQSGSGKKLFLPSAGLWYSENGEVQKCDHQVNK